MFYTIKIKKWFSFFVTLIIVLAIILTAVILYYPVKYENIVEKYSSEYALDPAFVYGLIHAESKFNEKALSNKSASGLMQLTEPTAVWLAEKINIENFSYSDIFDPEVNIRLGCYYINMLLTDFNNDMTLALASYNGGRGNVNKWLNNENYSQDGETLSKIPFKETKQFVKRVKNNTLIYKIRLKLLGGNK